MLLKFVDSLHFLWRKKTAQECCGSTFPGSWARCGLFLYSMKSLAGCFCHAGGVSGGGAWKEAL